MSRIKIKVLAAIAFAVLGGFIIVAGCTAPKPVPPPPPTAISTNLPFGPGPNERAHCLRDGAPAGKLSLFAATARCGDSPRSFSTATWKYLIPAGRIFCNRTSTALPITGPISTQYTINNHETADLAPAFEIYDCFLKRLAQHDAYVADLLKEDKFSFNDEDRLLAVDRRHSPYPKDLDEAKQLWPRGIALCVNFRKN